MKKSILFLLALFIFVATPGECTGGPVVEQGFKIGDQPGERETGDRDQSCKSGT